jgi:hypothetical protein
MRDSLAHYNAVIVADPEFECRTVQTGENRGSRSAELPLTQADKGSLIDTVHNDAQPGPVKLPKRSVPRKPDARVSPTGNNVP